MGTAARLRNFLQDPALKDIDVASPELLKAHRRILREKVLMRHVFEDFYSICMSNDQRFFSGTGARVELGAGTSFLKSVYPEVLISDLQASPEFDLEVDAQNMPFENESVRAFYGLNCFHHFPNPRLFFNELDRVLVPGGGCVLIEPHYGAVARKFYRLVHAGIEGFDESQSEWTSKSLGEGSGPNQALSYMIFKRDRALWERENPGLELLLDEPISNYVRYLLSGGLNFRQLVPDSFEGILKVCERLLTPLHGVLALHHVVVLRKKER